MSQADSDSVTGRFRQCHRQIQTVSQADSDNVTGRFRQCHRQIQISQLLERQHRGEREWAVSETGFAADMGFPERVDIVTN